MKKITCIGLSKEEYNKVAEYLELEDTTLEDIIDILER